MTHHHLQDKKHKKIQLHNQEEIYHFFRSTRIEHFVSYRDYKQIFQYDTSYLQKINNYILNGYAHYRNYCHNQLLPYKYIPIALATVVQLVRLRPPPILFPIIYVYALDYYFLDYMLWKKRQEKIINIQEAFNYKLIKKQKQIKRNRYLNEYLDIINKEGRQFKKQLPQKWIDLEVFTPYVFVNGAFDPKRSYCQLTKQYSMFTGLLDFGMDTLTKIGTTLKQDVKLFLEFKEKQKQKQYNKEIYNILDSNIQPNYRTYWVNVLEEKIQNYVEIFNKQYRGTTNKVDWKFYDLVTTRTYIDQDHNKIRISNNTSELLIYYSLISLPYLLARLLRRG